MNYSDDSAETRELLALVAAGNAPALDKLLSLHRPYLERVISMRIEPELRSRVDASDIVQDAQVVIAERIDDFLRRRPTSFRIWIRRKAIERLVDQRRAHVGAKKRTVYKEQPLANSSRFIARQLLTDTPSKILQRNELQEQVRELIDSLSANDREILTLRHAEGLTNTEVAQLLTIDPNTVRQRHGRALRRLHQRLEENGITLNGVSE